MGDSEVNSAVASPEEGKQEFEQFFYNKIRDSALRFALLSYPFVAKWTGILVIPNRFSAVRANLRIRVWSTVT